MKIKNPFKRKPLELSDIVGDFERKADQLGELSARKLHEAAAAEKRSEELAEKADRLGAESTRASDTACRIRQLLG